MCEVAQKIQQRLQRKRVSPPDVVYQDIEYTLVVVEDLGQAVTDWFNFLDKGSEVCGEVEVFPSF